MLSVLHIFLLLVVGNLFCPPQAAIVERVADVAGHIKAVGQQHALPSDAGYLNAALPQCAIAGNQRNNVRTSTSRSLRSRSLNTSWRGGWGPVNHFDNLLNSNQWTIARRLGDAPFPFRCPCDYYVIALRHIIR